MRFGRRSGRKPGERRSRPASQPAAEAPRQAAPEPAPESLPETATRPPSHLEPTTEPERAAAGTPASEPRPADLRLARVHLRTGALALARAELEMLAGQDRLDTPAVVDLAEARWRTGDLLGAGEAASAALGAGSDEALAFVIAAEAAAAQDRPAEARRLAGRALERTTASLDSIFAGIPLSPIWPHDAWSGSEEGAAEAAAAGSRPRTRERARPGQAGLWEESGGAWTGEIDVDKRLAAATRAIAGGDLATAAVHLSVVLRFAPRSADAVLAVVDASTHAALEIVRGDALRLVGSEWEARRAFVAAARAVVADPEAVEPEAAEPEAVEPEVVESEAPPDAASSVPFEPPASRPVQPAAGAAVESQQTVESEQREDS